VLIALASLDQIWENKSGNLSLCEELIQTAKIQHSDLVIFPEMTLTGFSMNISSIAEQSDRSQTVDSFKNLADKYNISIIFGVVFNQFAKASNNAVFMNRSGEILGTYQKIHPFSFSNEDVYFESGDKILRVKFESILIGITICYDLRFPELYSALGASSDLIVNIANWPYKRIEHWETLLKARAIENQIFVAGVNRTGEDNNGNFYKKSSMLIDANGKIMAPIYSEDHLDIYDVNKMYTSETKSKFSTIQDRNVKLYKNFL
jgi:omega-amidase